MSLKSSILLPLSLITSISLASESAKSPKLFLVGGGLKTCSSMSSTNCLTRVSENNQLKKQPQYEVNKHTISQVFDYWPKEHLNKQRSSVHRLLNKMASENAGVINKINLRKLWQKFDKSNVINKLADKEFYLMLDTLEVPVNNEKGQRIKELVRLNDSKNPFSIEIFNQFVALAKTKTVSKNSRSKPKVLVVTASSRDTFEAVDFYLQVFSQAGADVEWLPIDAATNFAWQQPGERAQHCGMLPTYRQQINGAYNRESVYPDLAKHQQLACLEPDQLIKKIASADGLFINGGDQSLTLQAFKNSDDSDNSVLRTIKTQLNNNLLVVGGTSAGTAVMSGGQYQGQDIPMITNGRSELALVRGAKPDQLPSAGCQKLNTCDSDLLNGDLTYNSHGGIGLFQWGVLDTHFSERGRQGRLAQLTRDTQTNFGFGVDEATALEVAWDNAQTVSMKVVGQGGVFIVQNQSSDHANKGFMTHYVTREDAITLEDNRLSFVFANWKIKHTDKSDLDIAPVAIFEDDNYRILAQLLCLSDKNSVIGHSLWNKNTSEVMLKKSQSYAQVTGGVVVAGKSVNYCSYNNLELSY